MTDKPHWTATHIRERTAYFAYDEAGLLLGMYDTYEEAEETLIKYAKFLETPKDEETT